MSDIKELLSNEKLIEQVKCSYDDDMKDIINAIKQFKYMNQMITNAMLYSSYKDNICSNKQAYSITNAPPTIIKKYEYQVNNAYPNSSLSKIEAATTQINSIKSTMPIKESIKIIPNANSNTIVNPLNGLLKTFKHFPGIENLGNTCYLSSAIKCIACSYPFTLNCVSDNVLNGKYTPFYNELIALIKSLLSNRKCIIPAKFIDEMEKLDKTYNKTHQNDCFQAVIAILDFYHQATKKDNASPLPSFDSVPIGTDNDKLIKYTQKCLLQLADHASFMYDMFLSIGVCVYHCPACGDRFSKFDMATGIPYDITNQTSIEGCIKTSLEMESFPGYNCKACSQKVNIEITKMPILFAPILIFHLKRIKVVDDKYYKDSNPISFPLSKLDVSKYISSNFVDKLYNAKEMAKLQYNLLAVVIHEGKLAGGHYYLRLYNMKTKEWEEHDDSSLEVIESKKVPSNNALTLVYLREDMFDIEHIKTTKISDMLNSAA